MPGITQVAILIAKGVFISGETGYVLSDTLCYSIGETFAGVGLNRENKSTRVKNAVPLHPRYKRGRVRGGDYI